jgi:hypothetical protein
MENNGYKRCGVDFEKLLQIVEAQIDPIQKSFVKSEIKLCQKISKEKDELIENMVKKTELNLKLNNENENLNEELELSNMNEKINKCIKVQELKELKEEYMKLKEEFRLYMIKSCSNCKDCGGFCNGCYWNLPNYLKTDKEKERDIEDKEDEELDYGVEGGMTFELTEDEKLTIKEGGSVDDIIQEKEDEKEL